MTTTLMQLKCRRAERDAERERGNPAQQCHLQNLSTTADSDVA